MKYQRRLPVYGIAAADGDIYLGRLSRNGVGDYVHGIRLRRINKEMVSGCRINLDAASSMLDLFVNPEEGHFQLLKNSLTIMYPLTEQHFNVLRRRLFPHL